jgi:lysophospholipase L1-like esterase
MSIFLRQIIFIFGAVVLSPVLPFLYLQGQLVRRRVGRLPDAAGETVGLCGDDNAPINLLAIGESTVAGVGAPNHAEALTGQLARHFHLQTGESVRWHALGESGITVNETIKRLLPQMPDEKMEIIVIALGGNDVFKLSSPLKWRRGMTELLQILRNKHPQSKILLVNVPMVRDFPALPQPLRYVLSRVAKSHHFNTIELSADFQNVYYFDTVGKVSDDFYSDGVHPSAKGYSDWAEEIIKFYLRKSR